MPNQNIITQDVRTCHLISPPFKLNHIFKTKLIRVYKHSKIKQYSVFKTRKSCYDKKHRRFLFQSLQNGILFDPFVFNRRIFIPKINTYVSKI